jgi:3-keto-5-aminohexanoate cleavage enzyme
MIDGLQRITRLIRNVDSDAKLLVCSAGRASSYLVTLAALAGLHIRVGMEDTVWRWPHRQEKIESNLQAFEAARDIVTLLGREVATPAAYREIMGLASVKAWQLGLPLRGSGDLRYRGGARRSSPAPLS